MINVKLIDGKVSFAGSADFTCYNICGDVMLKGKWVVAVSGGSDSMTLLDQCVKAEMDLIADVYKRQWYWISAAVLLT